MQYYPVCNWMWWYAAWPYRQQWVSWLVYKLPDFTWVHTSHIEQCNDSTNVAEEFWILTDVNMYCVFLRTCFCTWLGLFFILLCVGHVIQMQPDTISITAVLIEYETLTKRQMHGVTTGWLRYRRPTDSERPTVPIFVRKSQFRLPFKPSVPVILIGPGTGLAPMRGFIQDRYSVFKDGKAHLCTMLNIALYYFHHWNCHWC